METTRPKAYAVTRLFATVMVVTGMAAASQITVVAQDAIKLTSSESTVNKSISQSIERVQMLVKSSRILTLEERIPKFQVHNETILGATPVSQNQIQIFAKVPGTTQLNLWDTNDKMYTVDVTVTADAREVEGILANQLPFASLQVLPVNSSAIVSGTVTNVDDVDRAVAIVEQFYPTVVNNVQVVGVQQILLHTRVMEVSRTKLRELGIDWGVNGSDGYLTSGPSSLLDVAGSTADADGLFTFANSGAQLTNQLATSGNDFFALIQALRQQDLVKLLAEPTVVATHGRPARFNVGGKTPYILPGQNGQVSIAFEEFGTSIDFLPFVVGPGRVRLEIRPEVSELNAALGISLQGTQVPGFSTRYVETAVEMQAGQTFAIAGLLQSRTEAQTRSTPILGDMPFIGSLFRRVVEERNDIELLITVTPELVAAMDPYEVPVGGPGLNSMSPTDKELYVKGHIEVPNLLGDGAGCTVDGGQSSCGPDCGCSSCNGGQSGVAVHQPSYGGGISYGGEMHGGTILPPSIPSGAIVPGNDPIVVGEGITITSPSN
jgi:pilus assembly protein CpaC